MNIAQHITSLLIANMRKQVLAMKPGTIHTLTYKKVWEASKIAKGNKHLKIEEIKQTQVRIGIDPEKAKEVRENRASGEQPAKNEGLPSYLSWLDKEHEGYILKHDNGQTYLRTYRRNDKKKGVVGFTKYFVEGKEVTKEKLQSLLIPSALSYKNKVDMPYRNFKEDQIISIV